MDKKAKAEAKQVRRSMRRSMPKQDADVRFNTPDLLDIEPQPPGEPN